MKLIIKGGPTSGWYGPPRGTHSGEEHRAVGSGKVTMRMRHPPSKAALESLRGDFASAAQKIYDEWDPEEGWYGGGGICDDVSSALSDIAVIAGFDVMEGGQPGDDHAYIIAYTDTEAFGVDIPAGVYESGGGYSWTKVPDITIRPQDVDIWEIDRADIVVEE